MYRNTPLVTLFFKILQRYVSAHKSPLQAEHKGVYNILLYYIILYYIILYYIILYYIILYYIILY